MKSFSCKHTSVITVLFGTSKKCVIMLYVSININLFCIKFIIDSYLAIFGVFFIAEHTVNCILYEYRSTLKCCLGRQSGRFWYRVYHRGVKKCLNALKNCICCAVCQKHVQSHVTDYNTPQIQFKFESFRGIE